MDHGPWYGVLEFYLLVKNHEIQKRKKVKITRFGFQCVAKHREEWLKICTLFLFYSQIWLNLHMYDSHFILTFFTSSLKIPWKKPCYGPNVAGLRLISCNCTVWWSPLHQRKNVVKQITNQSFRFWKTFGEVGQTRHRQSKANPAGPNLAVHGLLASAMDRKRKIFCQENLVCSMGLQLVVCIDLTHRDT